MKDHESIDSSRREQNRAALVGSGDTHGSRWTDRHCRRCAPSVIAEEQVRDTAPDLVLMRTGVLAWERCWLASREPAQPGRSARWSMDPGLSTIQFLHGDL